MSQNFTNFQLPSLSNTLHFTGTQIIGTSQTNSSQRDSSTKKDVLCATNDSFPLELVMIPVYFKMLVIWSLS